MENQYRIKRVGHRYFAQMHWNNVWIDLKQSGNTLAVAKKTIDYCREVDKNRATIKTEIIEY